MSDLTIFPADITEMSISQLAALSPEQKHEISKNLDCASDWLKKARAKFDAALDQCYREQISAIRHASGKDFGVCHLTDGPLRVTVDQPKRVSWDQAQLSILAKRIEDSGEHVSDYIDIEYSIAEFRYTNWPTPLQELFSSARTVKPGKASYRLALLSTEGKSA